MDMVLIIAKLNGNTHLTSSDVVYCF
jgi:hypothetical protein